MNEKRIKQITKTVKRLAPSYGVNKDLEEDLIQETLLKAWTLSQNEQTQPLRYMVIDTLRTWRGRGVTEQTKSPKHLLPGHTLPYHEEMAAGATSALDSTALDFRRQLNRLKVRERVVTILYYIYGLDLKEIGYCFGVGESRASQYLREAQRLMRAMNPSF